MPKKEHAGQLIIWPYTKATRGKKKWIKTSHNTPKTADDTDGNMGKTQNCATRQMETTGGRSKGEMGERKLGKYMTTWASQGGNISRQIDYITINAKRRNVARTAQSNIYWRGNMKQKQQHRIQKTHLCYSASEKYKKPMPADTGERLKYDIK